MILGSRSAERAVAAAERLGRGTTGFADADAAAAADIPIVTVPFATQEPTLRQIAPPAFGADSFRHHRIALPAARIVTRPGLALDVDDADDLAEAVRSGHLGPMEGERW